MMVGHGSLLHLSEHSPPLLSTLYKPLPKHLISVLGSHEIEELIDLPVMSKPESVAAVEVMDKALPPALFTDTNLFPLLLWRIVNFSLEHGNTDASCYAYVHGGTLAGARFGNNRAGFR